MYYVYMDESGTDSQASSMSLACVATSDPFRFAEMLEGRWRSIREDLKCVESVLRAAAAIMPRGYPADRDLRSRIESYAKEVADAAPVNELHTSKIFGAMNATPYFKQPAVNLRRLWFPLTPVAHTFFNLAHHGFLRSAHTAETRKEHIWRHLELLVFPETKQTINTETFKRRMALLKQKLAGSTEPYDVLSAVLDVYVSGIRSDLLDLAVAINKEAEVFTLELDGKVRDVNLRDSVEQGIGFLLERVGQELSGPITLCFDRGPYVGADVADRLARRWATSNTNVVALVPLNSSGSPGVWAADLVAYGVRGRPGQNTRGVLQRECTPAVPSRALHVNSAEEWSKCVAASDACP